MLLVKSPINLFTYLQLVDADVEVDVVDSAVAVVTGAAGGLGYGLAASLVSRGMSVVIADIDGDALASAEERLRAEGADVLAVRTDVTKAESVMELSARTFDRFGRVDVVCLNAGVSMRGRAWELSISDWRWVYDVNVFGVVHGIRAFVPALLEAGTGHVLITASNSAVTTLAALAPYVSSKHAVVAVAETLQHDVREVGSDVGVSVVLPGAIRSGMADALRHRPADYGSASIPEDVTRASRAFLDRFGADPRAMADDVLRHALDERRFCIFTDPADAAMLVTHTEALRDGELPPVIAPVSQEVK
ncbi:SDR family NAD(P)-dependent oxidoreductase [Nocardia sp. NPDC006982]|uniref:SDR family NAD(P)-dependent oxidoreductase n=1 Tax=Nocardia sp. NPDC006982 TaxID=3364307 RepID=UPI003681A973